MCVCLKEKILLLTILSVLNWLKHFNLKFDEYSLEYR